MNSSVQSANVRSAPVRRHRVSYEGNGNTLTGDATTGTNTLTSLDQLASVTVGGARSYTYQDTSNAQRATAAGVTFTTSVLGTLSSDTGGAADRSYIRDPDGTLIALKPAPAATTTLWTTSAR